MAKKERHAIMLRPKSKTATIDRIVVFVTTDDKTKGVEQAKATLKSPTRWVEV